MRLAVVSPFLDRRHGTERALSELLERLAREKHCEVHIYAQRAEDLALDPPRGAISPNPGSLFWHRVPSVPGPHLLKFVCWLMLNSLCRAWDRRFRGLHFDLVLSPGVNCFDADIVIVHVIFRRLQELARDAENEVSPPGFLRRLHRRAYYALLTALERRIYANPKVSLAAVSQRTAMQLAEYFHRMDVQVISNGVDTLQFSPPARLALRSAARQRRNFRDQDFVLLLIGNDWRVKGLDAVFNAMGALRDLQIYILVVGDDVRDSFLKCAKDLGILQHCHFEEPRPDVLDFYAAADLYVSPSREDSFALPVAEAMACGLPAITSTCAGVADLIQNGVNGFVLRDAQDTQELARILGDLYYHPESRARIGAAAAELALHWSWEENATAVFAILSRLSGNQDM